MLSDRIRNLCEQAANEKDGDKLMELVGQIIDAFDEFKERRHSAPGR